MSGLLQHGMPLRVCGGVANMNHLLVLTRLINQGIAQSWCPAFVCGGLVKKGHGK